MLDPNFTPFPVLNTNRLLLEQVEQKDAADLLSLRSNEKVMQYIDKEKSKTIEEVAAFIKRIEDDAASNDGITWRISLKDNPGKLIGTIGYWRIIKQHHRAEIGYMLHPDLWAKGLMNEALQ